MTSSNRVDASGPFLDELRTLAAKGFDGSVSATANGLEVAVYLTGGEVYAIQSPQFTFPSRELAVAYTGVEPVGDDPLRWLYETINAADDQGRGLRADDVDRIVRNWSYGLLASALTWRSPKLRRQRKVTASGSKFMPTALQVVLADVTARVDDLVSSWAILTDYLATLPEFAAGARPASVACSKLVLEVDGHPLLAHAHPVDEVARRLGTTRYELLSAAARVLLSGGQVKASLGQLSGDLPAYPVPESLEDTTNEWASVEATAAAERPALERDDSVDASEDADPSHVAAEQGEDVEKMDYAALLEQAQVVPTPVVDEELQEDHSDPADLLATSVAPADPDALDENPLEGAVEVYAPSDALTAPGDPLSPTGAAQWRQWVAAVESERERSVRDDIYRQAVQAAIRTAQDRLAALESKIDELDAAAAEANSSREAAADADADARAAEAERETAEAEARRIAEEGEAYLRTEESARQEADAAAAAVAASQEEVEAAERALAEARERLRERRATQDEATLVLQGAADAARVHYHEPLAVAQQAVSELERDVVAPARERRDRAVEAAHAAAAVAEGLVDEVHAVGYETEVGILAARDIDDTGEFDSDPLVVKLEELHGRMQAIVSVPAAIAAAAAQDADESDGDSVVDAELVDEREQDASTDEPTSDLDDSLAGLDEAVAANLATESADADALDELAQSLGIDEGQQADGAAPVEQPADDLDDPEVPEDDDLHGFLAAAGIADTPELADTSDNVGDAVDETDAGAWGAVDESDDADPADEFERLLSLAQTDSTGASDDAVPPAPTFDQVLSDEMPQAQWNGQTVQWGFGGDDQ